MADFIEQVRVFIETHQEWAGPVTALLTLGESLLVVGLFVPATALMLITGGLVGSGTLDGWSILAWGVAGAVAGDAVSYGIGRWMGPGVLRRWPMNRQRSAVARARLFFRRYGFASVLAGRFLGPIRSTIPAVAGIMGMSHVRFQLANVLSALAWTPATRRC
jgi:membrane protein DedA with SNARE-associated domain